ncbi:hypothetical protein DVR11_17845 [Paracoccus versutus]|nr:hypothetical protein DVR11_17845 [Paracoccus versutus]
MFGLGAGWLSTLKMSSEHLDCSQSFLSRILIDDRVEDTVSQQAPPGGSKLVRDHHDLLGETHFFDCAGDGP